MVAGLNITIETKGKNKKKEKPEVAKVRKVSAKPKVRKVSAKPKVLAPTTKVTIKTPVKRSARKKQKMQVKQQGLRKGAKKRKGARRRAVMMAGEPENTTDTIVNISEDLSLLKRKRLISSASIFFLIAVIVTAIILGLRSKCVIFKGQSKCQPKPGKKCSQTSECEGGQSCVKGVCTGLPCKTDADCSAGFCSNNVCLNDDQKPEEDGKLANWALALIAALCTLVFLVLLFVLYKWYKRKGDLGYQIEKVDKAIFEVGGEDRETAEALGAALSIIKTNDVAFKLEKVKLLLKIAKSGEKGETKIGKIRQILETDEYKKLFETKIVLSKILRSESFNKTRDAALKEKTDPDEVNFLENFDTGNENVDWETVESTLTSVYKNYLAAKNLEWNPRWDEEYKRAKIATEKLAKKQYRDVSDSIGKKLTERLMESNVYRPFKRIFVGPPGIGKSQSIANWVIKQKQNEEAEQGKAPLVVEVLRDNLGTDGTDAAIKMSELDAMSRYWVAMGYPVLMTFEEAQGTVGDPVFQDPILRYTEKVPYSVIATTNKKKLFKGEVGAALASRWGGTTYLKKPRLTKANIIKRLEDALTNIIKETGMEIEYEAEELRKEATSRLMVDKKNGWRPMDDLQDELMAQALDAKYRNAERVYLRPEKRVEGFFPDVKRRLY